MIDATRPLNAPAVIAADRNQGVRCSPSRCVEAWALRRLPGVLDVRVGADYMRLLRRNGWVRYWIDRNTKATTQAYDDEGQQIPVGFVGRYLPPPVRLGARAGEKPGSNRRSGKGESVATRKPSHRHIDVEPT